MRFAYVIADVIDVKLNCVTQYGCIFEKRPSVWLTLSIFFLFSWCSAGLSSPSEAILLNFWVRSLTLILASGSFSTARVELSCNDKNKKNEKILQATGVRKIYYLKNDIISNAINYYATWWAKVIKSCIWNKKNVRVLQVRGAASVGGDGQREEHDTRDEKFAGIKRGGLGGAWRKIYFYATDRDTESARCMLSVSYWGRI